MTKEIKLTQTDEAKLRRKFDKFARASEWTTHTTYFIRVGTRTLRSKEPDELWNQLKAEFIENKEIIIW